MTNQNYDYDALRAQMQALLAEKRTTGLRSLLTEMNSFDVAEFLTELREDSEQLMVLVYLLLSK